MGPEERGDGLKERPTFFHSGKKLRHLFYLMLHSMKMYTVVFTSLAKNRQAFVCTFLYLTHICIYYYYMYSMLHIILHTGGSGSFTLSCTSST